MSLEGDWRAGIDDVDAVLIDEYQSDFPVQPRPFRAVADTLAERTDTKLTEAEVVDRVQALRDAGVFRRFGAVLNPPVVGSSTLAAVSAPEDRFEAVAEVINGYRQVNHNYRRDHEWNMWFVVTAASQDRRDEILAEIEDRTGCEVLTLPMLTDYYIDLEFPVVNDDRFARESVAETEVSATRISEAARSDLSALEAALLVEIQDGFPLSTTPYADVADAVADAVAEEDHLALSPDTVTVERVVDAVDSLLAAGCVKRIGCVVNHLVTGFENNCMVVWDVPDDELDARGEEVGSLPYVTLCYHRPRRPEQDWPYNLFTMIHGREADAVDAKIDELAGEHLPFEHERLYSTATLKQTGAQYEELLAEE